MDTLLENGANPYAKITTKDAPITTKDSPPNGPRMFTVGNCFQNIGVQCTLTKLDIFHTFDISQVFHTLLFRNKNTAGNMLNSWMDTNGQELDSSDLLIIYDLQGFYHEAFGDMSSEPDETHDEVAAHAKMIGVGAKEFLQHPVSEIMLHLKWQRIKRVFQVN